MHRRAAVVIVMVALLVVGTASLLSAAPQQAGAVFVCRVADAITPVTAEYVTESLADANERGAALFLLQIDTPGGLDLSMRAIIQSMLASDVPTAVWVAPSGARAASAGFVIAMAADVVVMASGTNMGAATPVSIGGGEMDETMHTKLVEDASAYIRSLAERRGRPVAEAVQAVSDGRSYAASEAIDLGLADAIANSLPDVITAISGRTVRAEEGTPQTIDLSGAVVEQVDMSLRQRVLAAIANPQIAYFLLLLGVGGLYFELSNPGAVAPGVVGAISLVLALLAFQQLPFSYAGLALLFLGVVFLILEIKVVSFGLLTVAGLICFVLGSMLLFRGPIPELRLSLQFVLPVATAFVLLMAMMVQMVVRTHRGQVRTGREGLIAEIGKADTDFGADGHGTVFVHGELWRAHAADPVKRGDHVQVVGVGANLEVEVAKVAAITADERSPGASATRGAAVAGRSSAANGNPAAGASSEVSDVTPSSEEERT
ncbi:MAG: nodulation protein NfeD [Acidobacteriota bacterium]|jgi:membrane-bound serine protease (ClpP class)